MSLALLRQILLSQLSVTVESTPALVAKVESAITRRINAIQAKNGIIPAFKAPVVEGPQAGRNPWVLRPIDLLRKLGTLTTPTTVNMSRLSASWATRRYFWAISPASAAQDRFRLSQDARDLDFHQKTLLSDEFGVAFAGLLMERFYGVGQFVDISIAVADPGAYQGIQQAARVAPDYLMWGSTPNSPYYVVECKGCQTTYSASVDQLRRGMEQLPTILFAQGGARPIHRLVIGTLMGRSATRILVLDPPDSDEPGEAKRVLRDETLSERVNPREWLIKDTQKFVERSEIADDAHLLRWSGQFGSAAKRVSELGLEDREYHPLDVPLERRAFAGETFEGVSSSEFPELGQNVRLFRGVRGDILDAARRGDRDFKQRSRQRTTIVPHEDPAVSVSVSGTCFAVDGVL